MQQRKINLTGLILILLFVLGILFASKYSPGKNKLATICLSGEKYNSQELTRVLSDIKGIKTVFLDPKSELLTFRYDSSRLKLKNIKKHLNTQGIEAQTLKSVKLLKSKNEISTDKTKLFKLDISPSAK